jgi:hypothetical protein
MVIRHVGVWSVSRLYGALSASVGLLAGVLFALIGMAGGMAAMKESGAAGGLGAGAIGMMFGVGAIIFLPLFYGVMGLAMGALMAALYNLFAGLLGGIELDTEP